MTRKSASFLGWLFGTGGLKRTILIPFLCLLLFGFLAGWVLYLRGSRAALFEAVDALVNDTAMRVGDRVADYLNSAAALASANAAFFGSLEKPSSSVTDMQRTFRSELLRRTDIDIVSIGFADGEYAEAQRMPEGYVRIGRAGQATGGKLVLQRVGPLGSPGAVEVERPGYDPRERPWWATASAALGPVFTSPYAIVSTGELAMAAVVPYRSGDRLEAVATADLRLDALSTFIARIDTLDGGLAGIADQDGLLLAVSSGGPVTDRKGQRIRADEAPDRIGRLFAAAEALPPGRVFVLSGAGGRLRAAALDRDVGIGQRWRIVAALPEHRFTAPLGATDSLALLILAAMLLVTILLAFLAAARIASPLRLLAASIESLSLEAVSRGPEPGDLSAREMTDRLAVRPDEIGHLARAFAEMRSRLDESYRDIKSSLREKEVLLKEVHHRVKNNLQIVSSMLSLEEGHCEPDSVGDSFERLQDRIQAMAFVHEDLYRSGDFGSVHMDSYLSRIAESLAAGSGGSCLLHVAARAPSVELPLELALPCGLIVNELVTNCIKHAFVGRREGSVEVAIEAEQGGYLLSVADDGIGMEPALPEGRRGGIGAQLVASLSQQLHGSMEVESSPRGTRVTLRFGS